MLALGVLASGRGSNLQAVLDACTAGRIGARVVAVASNRADALALDRAVCHDVSSKAFARGAYRSKSAQEEAIVAFMREQGVELVVLAGYVPIIGRPLLEAYRDRIINVHPSLLPAFGGTLHAQAAALTYGVKVSGCTVHYVTEDVDAGPIILQQAVPVLEGDTEETLARRILDAEHEALPTAIGWIAAGRVVREGRRVRIQPECVHKPDVRIQELVRNSP